jgi:ribosome-binding protein aMBF1 (putative translation factor)
LSYTSCTSAILVLGSLAKGFVGCKRLTNRSYETFPPAVYHERFQDAALSGMDIREVLALNLRKLRRARGFSQEELAHRAKIDRTYISSLERSIYAAGIDVVDRLGRALGVEAEDLLSRPAAEHGERKKDAD